jgi:hypothetical protein
MYSTKRLEKGTVIEYSEVNSGKIKGIGKRIDRTSFAVVDEQGNIAKDQAGRYQIFSLKIAADKTAELYNKKEN